MSKRIVWAILVVLVVFMGNGYSSIAKAADSVTITVNVTGDSRVNPDMAQIWLGVQSQADTATEALHTSNSVVEDVLAAIGEYTRPELVKTTEFNLYRRERWNERTQDMVAEGFVVRHIYEVPVFDLSYVPMVVDTAVTAGANVIQRIQYAVMDTDAAREEAYRRALDEAWWKARLLVDEEEYPDLRLMRVEEVSSFSPMFAAEGRTLMADGPSIHMPGQLRVAVNLQVEFAAEK